MDKAKLLEGLKKIKEAFQSVQKFVDAKLNDGVTIIRYDDELKIGTKVLAVTEQGAIDIPDGNYTLEDGTEFTIVGSIVSEITPMEPKTGMQNPGQNPSAPSSEMTDAKAKSIIESIIKESRFISEDVLNEKLSELTKEKENFASQKTESDKTIADLKKEIDTQKLTIKEMFSLLETIAGEPSAPPAEPSKQAFNIKDFRKAYREDLQNINKKINN